MIRLQNAGSFLFINFKFNIQREILLKCALFSALSAFIWFSIKFEYDILFFLTPDTHKKNKQPHQQITVGRFIRFYFILISTKNTI